MIDTILKEIYGMKMSDRLRGIPDAKSTRAIFSRGKNVYRSVSNAAHSGGGPQFGRPRKQPAAGSQPVITKDAIARRRRRGSGNS